MFCVEDENKRLESVIERHVALIPKVKETQVKSEVSSRAEYLINVSGKLA